MDNVNRNRLNPISLIFLEILVLGVVGIPFAYLFDRSGYEENFTAKLGSGRFMGIAFASIIYAVLVMAFLYRGLGLKRKIASYMCDEMIPMTTSRMHWLWFITFGLSLLCFLYVLIQLGGHHPALEALRSDYFGIKVLRREVGQSINMNVFNFGLKFILPLNLILALFFLRKRLILLISSIALFLIMSTLILEKGQIVSVMILVIFFRMLMSPPPLKKLFLYVLIGLVLISFMYFLTKFAANLSSLSQGLTNRIFYGQIADLPSYFEVFADKQISPVSLLPPYMTRLWGRGDIKPAARLVMEEVNPEAVKLGTAGVANSFFVGEAFAVGGVIGVLVSPFLVLANLWLFVYLFCAMKKNILFVFLFSWFLFKTFDGVFGGISYFVFSGLHLVLLFLFYYLLSYAFVKFSRRSPSDTTEHA